MKLNSYYILISILIVTSSYSKTPGSVNEHFYKTLNELEELKRQKKEALAYKKQLESHLQTLQFKIDKQNSLLGIPSTQSITDQHWGTLLLSSVGIVALTALTGGISGASIAYLLKATSMYGAAQFGGIAGGLVGAHGVYDSLDTTGCVHFNKLATTTIPQAAFVGGCVGGIYTIGIELNEGVTPTKITKESNSSTSSISSTFTTKNQVNPQFNSKTDELY